MGSLALQPSDLLTAPKAALSIGFTGFVSSTGAIQATRLLTPISVGLSPTEHASLRWTHRGSNSGTLRESPVRTERRTLGSGAGVVETAGGDPDMAPRLHVHQAGIPLGRFRNSLHLYLTRLPSLIAPLQLQPLHGSCLPLARDPATESSFCIGFIPSLSYTEASSRWLLEVGSGV